MTEQFERIGDQVRAAMERLRVSGVALGVLHAGGTETAGFGVTSVPNPLAVDAGTLFRIGSISKTFTATAVMRLVEAGQLDLDAPLRTYLPELRMAGDGVAERMTLRHSLNHYGGWTGDVFDDFGGGGDALARFVVHMAEVEQLTPLGEVFSYNNAAFTFAGRAIELATGRAFEAAVRELVLDPLGLTRTLYDSDDLILHRFALGHTVLAEGPTVSRPQGCPRTVRPAAGLYSCVEDLLSWARFHLGDGAGPDGQPLLRAETLRYMQSSLVPAGSIADAIGVTWQIGTAAGHRTVGHGGRWASQLSTFRMVPERSFAVAVLTNAHTGGELHGPIAGGTIRAYLGGENPKLTHQTLAAEQLRPYVGRYQATLRDLELTAGDGGLVLAEHRRGSPMDTQPPPPEPPPVRLAFFDADRVVGLDPPLEGARAEFLRDERERITWFRWNGRLHRRL